MKIIGSKSHALILASEHRELTNNEVKHILKDIRALELSKKADSDKGDN